MEREFEHRLTEVESRSKSNVHRLDEMQLSIAEHGRDIKSAFERIKRLEEAISRYHEHGG
jgi:uncharacterized coiled-coil protein SlyX